MTVDEAFILSQHQPPDSRQVVEFHMSEQVVDLVVSALVKVSDRLKADPEEKYSVSEVMAPALVAMVMRAYNAGFAAGKEVGVGRAVQ